MLKKKWQYIFLRKQVSPEDRSSEINSALWGDIQDNAQARLCTALSLQSCHLESTLLPPKILPALGAEKGVGAGRKAPLT